MPSPAAGPPDQVTVSAPAKINLALSVGELRPDGYHELRTVFHAVDLMDLVVAEPSQSIELVLAGEEAGGLAADQDNLAWRAATLLASRAGIAPAVRLRLTKRIPVAAGLAGGSADAAATLLACNRLWRLDLSAGELSQLAAALGSDVPFALHGGTAVGAGRGELLTEVPVGNPLHWVLAAATGSLSTPAVYAELDRQRAVVVEPVDDDALDQLLAAARIGDPAGIAPLLANDLQPAALALAPYLHDTLNAGAEFGALAGLVSGSGPTCVFLAADAEHARALAAKLAASRTCRNAWPVTGGVPGARVLNRAVASC
ncbi:MAG TPA: 4-(cytidine 5'-diphospho)-2-C-methyl-D-erythritol kinase [Jatrophihabitans sp.]|nr:4-(cytidine 5'-diphospho)-2-C-methyl-D-erythritol kinase [Jatrophihabitans sp.]